MNDLIVFDDNSCLESGKFRFEHSGMQVIGVPTFPEWQTAGKFLSEIHSHFVRPFRRWAAQYILFGEKNYGEMYAQALDETGLEYGTLANAVSVVRKIGERWNDKLSFSHHEAVAKLPPEQQLEFLGQAEQQNLTAEELRESIPHDGANRKDHIIDCPQCGMLLYLNRNAKVLKSRKPKGD